MSFNVIRYRTRPERADENQMLIEKVFAELSEQAPEGLRDASFRLDDGVTFVHVVEEADEDRALSDVPALVDSRARR